MLRCRPQQSGRGRAWCQPLGSIMPAITATPQQQQQQQQAAPRSLHQLLQMRGLDARLVPLPEQPIPPTQAIKSMVLVQKSPGSCSGSSSGSIGSGSSSSDDEAVDDPAAAVLVLLLGAHRVDVGAVAAHIGVPKARLRLATPPEAAALTGFQVGCIPPAGHTSMLRTLVDEALLQQHEDVPLYAGGGAPSMQLLISPRQLLVPTAAETGWFSDTPRPRPAADAQQQAAALASWAHQLPLPWPSGSEAVQLAGVVAQRRRIAKLLLFVSLVPESVPALPGDGTASYVRRLWQHPDDSQTPCEVQIICGKTIEASLGRARAVALFDQVRVGAVVEVTGRVQANPASRDRPGAVLDVVAQHVAVLHKSRDSLSKAIKAAEARAKPQQDRQEQQPLSVEQPAALPPSSGSSSSSSPLDVSAAGAPVDAPAAVQPASSSNGGTAASGVAAVAAAAAAKHWQLQLPDSRVHWVDSLGAIRRMQQAIMPAAAQPAGAGAAAQQQQQLVAIDSEWRPFERGQPATPVALLQLATRSDVFLVDLLAVCQPQLQQPQQQEADAAGAAPAPAGAAAVAEPAGDRPLSPAVQALGEFLLQLLTSPHILKAGFQLHTDLSRLQQSYPRLACFDAAAIAAAGVANTRAADGAAPLVRHVDLLALARAALPSLVKTPVMSLGKLTARVLGAPLDKTPQRSDWQARPLSDAQRRYAAADAAVLVALFDALLAQLPPGAAWAQQQLLERVSAASAVKWLPLTAAPPAEQHDGGGEWQ